MANSLYAEGIIPRKIKEKAFNQSLDSDERGVALLDCIESRFEVKPSDFITFVDILKTECFFEELADNLVQSYCE